jgi:hypothetical protein
MPVKPKSNETEQEFIGRCIGEEINAGYPQDQAAAICYSVWREGKMKKSTTSKVAMKINDVSLKYKGIKLNKYGEVDMEEPCWSGYIQIGTKIVDGREVPDCRGPVEGVD